MKIFSRHRLPELVSQAGQVPELVTEAGRRAVNATARTGRQAVYDAMRRVFDRPTPYALQALKLQESQPGAELAAAVMVKGRQDVSGSGIPAQSFLRAEIQGGARRWKRFEVALLKAGHLPRGWYAVPGKGARLDQWGNMSRGQVVQVMSYLQLFGVARPARGERAARAAGYRANSTEKSRARLKAGTASRFGLEFVLSSPLQAFRRGGLPFGIYSRQNNTRTTRTAGPPASLLPVVLFVKAARYRVRLDYFGELQRHAGQAFPAELARALASARRMRPLPDVQ